MGIPAAPAWQTVFGHWLLPLACLAWAPNVQASIPPTERAVLANLYTSTNGAGWTNKTNWNSGNGTECTWHGVLCDGPQNHVIEISLDSNHLVGPLPSLDKLKFLQVFSALNNQLSGPIPPFSNTVRVFWAGENQLTGSIPSLSAFPALTDLNVAHNQLTGSILAVSGSTALRVFYGSGNQFTGSIPSLSGLTSLQYFSVASNQLTGTIPSLSGLAALKVFEANNNQLTGSIPTLAGLASLYYLALGGNQLTGSIPALNGLASLQSVYLQGNQLTGSVPAPPSSLLAGGSDLCGNGLFSSGDPLIDSAWEIATGGFWLGCQAGFGFPEDFPRDCEMPPGWITPPAEEQGWQVGFDNAFSGVCSLTSGAVFPLKRSEVQLSGTFQAGTISFAWMGEGEPGSACLSFFIDSAEQAGGTCGSGWFLNTISIAAGFHVLRWSFTNTSPFELGPPGFAWIDDVVLPANTPLMPPVCTLTAAPSLVHLGGSSTLTVSCSPSATSYTWSSNTGFGSAVTSGAVSPTVTTVYTVTGTNADGPGNTASAAVVVPPPPTCSLTASPDKIAAGGSATLTASCSPAATSYAWSSNTGFGSAVASGTVSPASTATYSVAGVSADGTGPTASVTVIVAAIGEFPAACQLPEGWIVPGASEGWSIAVDSVHAGSCSLKSNQMFDSGVDGVLNKAQLQFSATFQAGTISFARRVSSEEGYDCLKFSIDGVERDIGSACAFQGGLGVSGEIPWGVVSVPITAGTHTIRWSYEKDGFVSSGSDAAWIDDVILPAHAAIPLPSAPTLVVLSQGATTARLAYAPPANTGGSPVTGYVVRWRLSNSSVLEGEMTTASLPSPFEINFNTGSLYYVYLSAITAYGEGPAALQVVDLIPQCDAPTSLYSIGTPSSDAGGAIYAPLPVGGSSTKEFTLTGGRNGVSVSVALDSPGDFQIDSTNCASLNAGQTCSIQVSFSPLSAGTRIGSLQISGEVPVVRCNLENGIDTLSIPLPIFGEGIVPQSSQSIAFAPLQGKFFGDAPFELGAVASSGLPVAFSSLTSATCLVSASTLTLVAAGTCTIAANQAGNSSFAPAPEVSQSFTIAKASQTITFNALADRTFGEPAFTVSATVNAPLGISFSMSTPGVCSVAGSTVSILAAGTCTINANQAGNANYNAAPQVSQSFTVAKATQVITFSAIANRTIGDPAITLAATATSNLGVVFSSLTPSTCTLSGGTLTLVAVGTCTIAANQFGDANYLAAPQLSRSFQIGALGTFALSVLKAGSGTGLISSSVEDGILCGTTCSVNYAAGTTVTLFAAPLNGSTFAGWSGACTGTASCQVTMSSALTVTATFTAKVNALTVLKAGSGSGTVTSDVAGISCGPTCSFDFNPGTMVTLSAAPSPGSIFTGWSGACSGTNGCAVAMDSAKTVTATFDGNPPRLFNISTRGLVLTGFDVMIAGFIIEGPANKNVVVTAKGPSLTQYGINNALPNPTLQLQRIGESGVLATNDDWATAANAAQLQASGLSPSNALEPAILTSLAPGAYTAIVEGAGGTTGVALVEVYEVDRPDVPLVNISTRGRVGAGGDVMIGGFVIQGSGPQEVAIVVTGPSLAAYGIANPLADPTITLVRMSDQSTIAINDNWGDAPNKQDLIASGFAPASPLEPAILMTLQPGAYTAIVSGVGGGTGVALLAVYATK